MKYLLIIVLMVAVLVTVGCVTENNNTLVTPTQTTMVPTIMVTTTGPSLTSSIQTPKTGPGADNPVPGKVTIYFFYGKDCGHCHKVMPFIQNLSKKYADVDLQMLEVINNKTNMAFFKSLNQKWGINTTLVPEVVVGDTVLIGDQEIPDKLEGVILKQIKNATIEEAGS